ncbi:serine protease [Sulfurimonas sp. HSL-1716]|uniref:S1 family peptidase n=1 Tax=Hydrocurvibacter sulfurireducens TaxID=3131937 RepID=UPI0031F97591
MAPKDDTNWMKKLSHVTVRLESKLKDNTISVGTGFFYIFQDDSKGYHYNIITNKHVVQDSIETTFYLSLKDDENKRSNQTVQIGLDEKDMVWINHPDANIDLCAMPLTPILAILHKEADFKFHIEYIHGYISNFWSEKFTSYEEVLMIGYPNGIWDQMNNRPIFRKGITATDYNIDYNGKKEFLIDIASYGGSSGSPVFWYDKNSKNPIPYLLGVLYAGMVSTLEGNIEIVQIPTGTKPISKTQIPINLGIIIKAECIDALEKEFVSYVLDIKERYNNTLDRST